MTQREEGWLLISEKEVCEIVDFLHRFSCLHLSIFLNLFVIAFFVYVYMVCRGGVHGGAFMSWYMHKSKDNF